MADTLGGQHTRYVQGGGARFFNGKAADAARAGKAAPAPQPKAEAKAEAKPEEQKPQPQAAPAPKPAAPQK